jgi:hypothetical protein
MNLIYDEANAKVQEKSRRWCYQAYYTDQKL